MATKKIRVHELAKELGMSNKEILDLSSNLGIGVKSASSSIEDAQADRVRRKADADGLRRDVQPEEAPVKKAAAAKKTAATKSAAVKETAGVKTTRSTSDEPELRLPPPAKPKDLVDAAPAPVAKTPEPVENVAPPEEVPRVVRSRAAVVKPAPSRTVQPDGPTTIRPTQRPLPGGAEGG